MFANLKLAKHLDKHLHVLVGHIVGFVGGEGEDSCTVILTNGQSYEVFGSSAQNIESISALILQAQTRSALVH